MPRAGSPGASYPVIRWRLRRGQRTSARRPPAPALARAPPAPGRPGGLSGLPHDPRAVQTGALYAGLPGRRGHGARFCAAAAAAGAVAVLTDPAGREAAIQSGLPVFVVADPRARLGEVAAWIYGEPSSRLLLIGVTGTAGKTTTTYLLESGMRAAGYPTGLIGGGAAKHTGGPLG